MLSRLPLLATLPALATALGNAVVSNHCAEPVYLWSVGSSVSGPYTIEQGASYSEQFAKDAVTGGKALKVTHTPDGLYSGAAQTVFAYNLDNGGVWYDLSDVFGDGFAGRKVTVESADASCQAIVWPAGVSTGGSQVKVCSAEKDVVLTLCA